MTPEESRGVWCFTELVWLRHGPTCRTVACWNWASAVFPSSVTDGCDISMRMYVDGRDSGWRRLWKPADQSFCRVDSREISHELACESFDAVLALRVTVATEEAAEVLHRTIHRLYSIIDWIGEDTIQCLHSDHVQHATSSANELTEVVVLETPQTQHELVYLAGEHGIPAGALQLELRNQAGECRQATYDSAVEPWSILRLTLRDCVPDLVEFAGGEAVSVSGTQSLATHFVRPYVHAVGARPGIYHGGDRYTIRPQPGIMYRFQGQGYGNPAYVCDSDGVTTTINLFNSHGDLEDDFWVDAWLYDEAGTEIAHLPRLALARRGAVTRIDIAGYLPDAIRGRFRGHVRLHYSAVPGAACYPAILQALMEYRGRDVVSRVMLWSDSWNTEDRVKLRRTERVGSWFRVWANDDLMTSFAASNCSTWFGYTMQADTRLVLYAMDGRTREHEVTIPAHGTAILTPGEIWPDAAEFLGHGGFGWARVESSLDLAKMQYTTHRRTGRMCFEHCLPQMFLYRGKTATPPGS